MAADGVRERRFQTGAVELNYAEGPPHGRPLVYLHGGSGRWQHGGGLVELLAERWHVHGLDLRGHGKSGWVTGHYRVRDYAGDVVAFLHRVVGEPAALYGHSLGGQVALLVAAEHPELVEALVLGDIPLGDEDTVREPGHQRMITFWRELAASERSAEEIAAALRDMPLPEDGRRAGDAFGEDSPWFPFMGETLRQLDPDMLTAVIDRREEMLEGYDVVALLPRVACPTLLVLADPAAGGTVTDDDAARALRLLPRGAQVRMEGLGHPLHATHPEPVARVIEAFLAEHGAGRAGAAIT
jgi:pimeloyl-ACP methyl ester carboxylesterase